MSCWGSSYSRNTQSKLLIQSKLKTKAKYVFYNTVSCNNYMHMHPNPSNNVTALQHSSLTHQGEAQEN